MKTGIKKKTIVTALIAFVLAALAGAAVWVNGNGTFAAKDSIELVGHRGYSSAYPENTMPAFEGAFDSGFSGVEIDIWESDNGDLMINHDSTTDRMSGVSEEIWHVNESNRDKYKIPYGDTEVNIPTLDEVLKFSQETGTTIYLHIKTSKDGYELSDAGVKNIINKIKEYEVEDRVIVFSTKAGVVRPFCNKGVRVGRISSLTDRDEVDEIIDWLQDHNCDTFIVTKMAFIRQKSFSRSIVKYCHKRDIQIGTYSTKTVDDLRFLMKIGADFAMSNFDLLTPYRDGVAASAPNITVQNNKNAGIKIQWNYVYSSDSCVFNVYRSEKGEDTGYGKIGTAKVYEDNKGVFVDKDVESGKSYWYRVSASAEGEESGYSQVVEMLRLDQPKTSAKKKGSKSVQITWNRVSGAEGYSVWRKTGKGSWKRIIRIKDPEASSYTDADLKKGKKYSYRIRAWNGDITSGASSKKCCPAH
ncbi:MAG: fibronectin type III domain-containing protein [Mogibacterium sp.]|nr:fibronectin type III domain-containing protein [Mogibacterium sp.]